MAKVTAKLTGNAPLLEHNGRLANPLGYHAEELKKISGKRKKTEADHMEMARIEFDGGLYVNAKGQYIIPSEMIEACLKYAGRTCKSGKKVQAGLYCLEDPILEFKDSDKTPAELWESGEYHLSVMVKVNQVQVRRTRPMFKEWECTVTVTFSETILSESEVIELFNIAGDQIGLGDWRPKYGRFTVEIIK